MDRESREGAAKVLAAAVLEAYKWEVIKRRADAYARKSGEKAGTWGMFAWWSDQRFSRAVEEQDAAYSAYEKKLLLPEKGGKK